MAVETIMKQPAEVLRRQVRFIGVVPAAIDEVIVQARGFVPGAAALLATASIVDGAAWVTLAAGGDGEHYLITVRASGAAGELAEAEIEAVVVDAIWSMPDGGPAYLSISEFVDRVGLPEVLRLTDGTGDGRIDRAMLVAALTDAQATADAHIAGRYALPLNPVPLIVKKIVADLARAALHPGGAPDGVADQAKLSMRMLERIQTGAMPIPAETPPAEAPAEAAILIAPGRRAYPDGLAGY